MLKLLIITPGFALNEEDDICIPALQIYLKELTKTIRRIEVNVISFNYPYESKIYLWNGIEVVALGLKQNNKLLRFFHKLIAYPRILNLAKDFQPDLIHSFWLNQSAIIGNRLSKRLRIPHLCTAMGQDIAFSNTLGILKLRNTAYIAVSDFQRRFSKVPIDAVVHWGIPPSNQELTPCTRDIDILGVGWINKVKNYEAFIRIVARLIHIKPKTKVVITGDGSGKETLEKLIRSLNLEDQITFTGLIKREEVLTYMRRSKVLLHTSSFESFGLVIAEALSEGMFTLSYNVGIAGKSPASHVAHNEDEMLDKAQKLLSSPLPNASLPYPVSSTVTEYVKIYEKMLNRSILT
ncbi:MAG: glycosyltransferase [Roseivirga sp.]|uniref:glycosyltransferase n=1 Tax=Roseivirga sp. TaxID=1964215 RepID=UPI001B13DD4B|nr:glycosyltransferase [Roseivirga sp.]MBO6494020.1 glycosyltransferase [Roseivirga sp.]